MNAEKRLQQEITELKLLVLGLSKIQGFPSELLELINIRTDNIQHIISSEPEITPAFVEDNDTSIVITSEVNEDITTIRETIHETRISGSSKTYNDLLSQTARINDRLESNRLVDLSKMLTLNDRFRFMREFFGNDAQKMTENLAAISQLGSFEEAQTLFREICPLGEESESITDFYMMLEKWFSQKPAVVR